MNSRPRCQCRPGCTMPADEGQPYLLVHDPRPERAEEKLAELRRRGRAGGIARAVQRRDEKAQERQQARRQVENAESLDSEEEIRRYVEQLAALAKTGTVTGSALSAGAKAAQVAMVLLEKRLDARARELEARAAELERLAAAVKKREQALDAREALKQ